MQAMAERFYTDEQAQEILSMASRSSLGSGAISHKQLLATAAELGISPEEVLQAERAFLETESIKEDRKTFRLIKRKEYLGSVSKFVTIAIVLYGICFILRGYRWDDMGYLLRQWPKWPVGIMGLFLIKDTIEYGLDMTVNREVNFDKWRKKQAKKAARDNEKEAVGQPASASMVIHLDDDASDQNHVRS